MREYLIIYEEAVSHLLIYDFASDPFKIYQIF